MFESTLGWKKSFKTNTGAYLVKGPLQAKTAPTRAAKKLVKPKLTALLRAPATPPGAGEVVVVGVMEGVFVVMDKVVGTAEREESTRELPMLKEAEQSVVASGGWI